MTRLFTDSFDHYTTADTQNKWSYQNYSPQIVAGGRYQNCVQMTTSPGSILRRNLPLASYTELFVAFAYKADFLQGAGSIDIFRFQNNGVDETTIRVDSLGRIGFYLAGTMICQSSPAAVQAGIFNHVQAHVIFATAATGSCSLKLNSVQVASATNVTTSTTGIVNQVALVNIGTGQQAYNAFYDDFWVNDTSGTTNNGFDGDIKIIYLPAAGAGQMTQFTPNAAGANWTKVSELAPDGDTTYNSAAAANLTDLYAVAALPTGVTAVVDVQSVLEVRKDDASPASVAPVIGNGTASTVGATVSIGNNYGYQLQNWGTNPNNANAAWVPSDITALQIGPKRTV